MRIQEIMEADEGKAKQSALVARLEKVGGDIVGKATNGSDVALIGINGHGKNSIHFVFYPDGSSDRFEAGKMVIYRTGYDGPSINDPVEIARAKQQAQWDKEDRAAEREDRAARREEEQEERRRQKISDKREKMRTKYRNVQIPPQYEQICDAAEDAIGQICNMIGPDLRSGLGSYDEGEWSEEATRYYDPGVILDLASDQMHDYCNGHNVFHGNDPDCSPQQWMEFKKLPLKYQLKVAGEWAGSFDY